MNATAAQAPDEQPCIAIKPVAIAHSKQGHHVFEGGRWVWHPGVWIRL